FTRRYLPLPRGVQQTGAGRSVVLAAARRVSRAVGSWPHRRVRARHRYRGICTHIRLETATRSLARRRAGGVRQGVQQRAAPRYRPESGVIRLAAGNRSFHPGRSDGLFSKLSPEGREPIRIVKTLSEFIDESLQADALAHT